MRGTYIVAGLIAAWLASTACTHADVTTPAPGPAAPPAAGVSAADVALAPAPGVLGYYRFPTLHGDRIVFSAENDLWQVSVAGGLATRLTTHPGNEAFPKFSPDGQWLAFSAEYEGNVDVYVMPAVGGEPRRLTWHPEADEVMAWRPDSRHIVFRSRRVAVDRMTHLYEVPRDGGPARLVPVGIASLASFSPDGRRIAFNRNSVEFRTWKRYTGGLAPDVWVGDLDAGRFHQLTDWEGTDEFPMWHGDRVLFASDRSGRLNLYAVRPDGGAPQQLTTHDEYDVRWPDAHDGRVVYMHGGDLWLLDVATGQTRCVPITLPSDRVRTRLRYPDATPTLRTYGLSDDGQRIVLAARGEVWERPTRPGRTVPLTQTPGIRERAPAFSPDGTQVAVISDETGEQELVLLDARGKTPPRRLTNQGRGWLFPPIWSPDGQRLAYADLTMTLYLVDVASGAVTTVDHSPVWEITEYAFSPDGKWLAYTKPEAEDVSSIYLYDIAAGRAVAITDSFTDDTNPVWDPEGRFLYFLSKRTLNPLLSERDFEHIITQTTKPYAVLLARGTVSPFLARELQPQRPEPPKPPPTDEDEEDGAEPPKPPTPPPGPRELPKMTVDLDGIAQRIVEFPVPPDNYSALRAIKGKVFYMGQPPRGLMEGRTYPGDWARPTRLHVFDFEKQKAEVFIGKLRDYTLSGDGERIAYRVDNEIIVGRTGQSPEKAKADDLDKVNPAELPLVVEPLAEWTQILAEAWRLQRDFYWVENMAGVDWPAERERYTRLLPRISTRTELNELIGQMIGELGTSHTYVWGGDLESAPGIGVGLLGADLEPDPAVGALRFVRVLRPEVWETDIAAPLTEAHAGVRDGDYLLAINHRPVTAEDDVHRLLARLAGQEVLLTVARQADRGDARDVQIKTLTSDRQLRYRDWCRRNREYVAAQTGGRVGYFHIPDMGGNGLVEFIKGFYPQVQKEGLIVDVRANGGGFVSQLIIDRLARQVVAFRRARRGEVYTYPARVHRGPKVCLINQQSGSDGDIFPESFKLLELGPVIGMRSWGGVVGIRGDKPFVDGGVSTQPEFSWWEPRRGWGLENSGVVPDIEVDILPDDYLAGRDPQLDRGIAEVLRMLEAQPVVPPNLDPPPDKSRPRPE